MFLNMKNRIFVLMENITKYISVLYRLKAPQVSIKDCLAGLESILTQLNKEQPRPQNTIQGLESVINSLKKVITNPSELNEQLTDSLYENMLVIKSFFEKEVRIKLNIAFFPYKASMWDSLETIYRAAQKDENCIVNVIPIPYYQLSEGKNEPIYEGNLFPNDVIITHYNDYKLEQERPDIIFVHNIYDNYNSLTCVDSQFFTSNLKEYTDMLVYVPYHISSFVVPKKGESRLAYSIPTVANVDRIILAANFLKDSAIREGIPPEKLLVLGSPKFDALVNSLREKTSYPEEWNSKIKGKKVYLINTGCLFFAVKPYEALSQLTDFFNIPRIDENSVVMWRPHPLTKTSIQKYNPDLLDYYETLIKNIKNENAIYEGIILDETTDYLPALKVADVLISTESSLLRSYLITEKKVIFWGEKQYDNSLVPENAFYYAYDSEKPWFKLVKEFSMDLDPRAENRINLASKIYVNTDGNAGLEIFQKIRDEVLGL